MDAVLSCSLGLQYDSPVVPGVDVIKDISDGSNSSSAMLENDVVTTFDISTLLWSFLYLQGKGAYVCTTFRSLLMCGRSVRLIDVLSAKVPLTFIVNGYNNSTLFHRKVAVHRTHAQLLPTRNARQKRFSCKVLGEQSAVAGVEKTAEIYMLITPFYDHISVRKKKLIRPVFI